MKYQRNKRILIIEDDIHIAEGLKLNLSLQGYDVVIAKDGVSGLHIWKKWRPNLVVLDIMLPGIDGLSVLQNIRLEDERVPILIVSAKAEANDKIKGLSCGVDDYLSKPFNLEEFLLRVERLLVKASWLSREEITVSDAGGLLTNIYKFGDNIIDFEKSTALCRIGKVTLTEQEIKLLKLFIANRGKALSRRKILEIGWGYTGSITTRTVDNFVARFRKYFEDDSRKPKYFKSIRLVGYVFENDL
ncbi:MAG: response regulator transcription factor [Desulfobacterium sp.]|nr:response regulator transcription factor [Desulfobacterium sp.]MBU3949446.1 response regulator transcription factor [Pseudomonadota bacterium]MBU4035937.1 response regulator transcription factor [Pseudomonadota bacterium]